MKRAMMLLGLITIVPACAGADGDTSAEDPSGEDVVGESSSALVGQRICPDKGSTYAEAVLVYGAGPDTSGNRQVAGVKVKLHTGENSNKVYWSIVDNASTWPAQKFSKSVSKNTWTTLNFPSTRVQAIGDEVYIKVSFTKNLMPDVTCAGRIEVTK